MFLASAAPSCVVGEDVARAATPFAQSLVEARSRPHSLAESLVF
jgi:hypothetical protein